MAKLLQNFVIQLELKPNKKSWLIVLTDSQYSNYFPGKISLPAIAAAAVKSSLRIPCITDATHRGACDKNISLLSHRINHLSTEPIYLRPSGLLKQTIGFSGCAILLYGVVTQKNYYCYYYYYYNYYNYYSSIIPGIVM